MSDSTDGRVIDKVRRDRDGMIPTWMQIALAIVTLTGGVGGGAVLGSAKVETRMAVVEIQVAELQAAARKVETRLERVATKDDVTQLKASIEKLSDKLDTLSDKVRR